MSKLKLYKIRRQLETNDPTMAAVKKKCTYCGNDYHLRYHCPARNVTCHKCSKKGNFSKVCMSSANPSSSAVYTPSLATITAGAPNGLMHTTIEVLVNGKKMKALIDSGSSESHILHSLVLRDKLPFEPKHTVSMACETYSTEVIGVTCLYRMIKDKIYKDTRFSILNNLCCDVILGVDFLSQHQSVVLQFGGNKSALTINKTVTSCHLKEANGTDPVSLFSNLSPECKPIVTKSRRFSTPDKSFIQKESKRIIDKWNQNQATLPGEPKSSLQLMMCTKKVSC